MLKKSKSVTNIISVQNEGNYFCFKDYSEIFAGILYLGKYDSPENYIEITPKIKHEIEEAWAHDMSYQEYQEFLETKKNKTIEK